MFYLPDPAPGARGMEDDAQSGSTSPPSVMTLDISTGAAILIGFLCLEGKTNLGNTADSKVTRSEGACSRSETGVAGFRPAGRISARGKDGLRRTDAISDVDAKQSANVTIHAHSERLVML